MAIGCVYFGWVSHLIQYLFALAQLPRVEKKENNTMLRFLIFSSLMGLAQISSAALPDEKQQTVAYRAINKDIVRYSQRMCFKHQFYPIRLLFQVVIIPFKARHTI
jgi:hypothetical protein